MFCVCVRVYAYTVSGVLFKRKNRNLGMKVNMYLELYFRIKLF